MRGFWIAVGAASAFVLQPQSPSRLRRHRACEEVMIVDGDNVRGQGDWVWSAAEMAAGAAEHARRENLTAVLFLDHGQQRTAMRLGPHAILAFAGPEATADDVIVDAVEWFFRSTNVSLRVVTSDYGLRGRLNYLNTKQHRGDRPKSHLKYLGSQTFWNSLPQLTEWPSYVDDFAVTHRRLADHVRKNKPFRRQWPSREKRRRAMFGKPIIDDRQPLITREQTWMRVLLAERLRLALQDYIIGDEGSGGDILDTFAGAYVTREEDDDSNSILLHRFDDRKQRHDLFRFADALRKAANKNETSGEEEESPPQEEDDDAVMEEEVVDEGPEPVLVGFGRGMVRPRTTRRERRKRARRTKELKMLAPPPPKAREGLKVLLQDRGELEDVIFHWLRETTTTTPKGAP